VPYSRPRVGWLLFPHHTRRLKRQNSQEHTDENWEVYRATRNLKGCIIKRVLQQGHRDQVEEAMKNPKKMWKLAR
jgi:hypothetical protein